jgi:hypothetical protein
MQSAQVHQAESGMPPLPEAAADAVQKERQDFPLVIATMPATDRHRAIAVGIVIVLIVAVAVMAPFASTQVGRNDAFIPILSRQPFCSLNSRSSLSAPFSRSRVVTYSAARSRSCRRWPFRAGTPPPV